MCWWPWATMSRPSERISRPRAAVARCPDRPISRRACWTQCSGWGLQCWRRVRGVGGSGGRSFAPRPESRQSGRLLLREQLAQSGLNLLGERRPRLDVIAERLERVLLAPQGGQYEGVGYSFLNVILKAEASVAADSLVLDLVEHALQCLRSLKERFG